MEMTGAKILMECLLEQGVDLVFGYPGGTIPVSYTHLACRRTGLPLPPPPPAG